MNDERDDLAETLRGIAKGSRRSKIVRLRECFDLVEEAKAQGASNKEIVAGLKEHGLIFDVPNFKNARSRILKERAMAALLQEAAPAGIGKSKNALHATTSRQPQSNGAETAVPAAPVAAPATGSRRPQIFKQATGMLSELKPSEPDGLVDLKQQQRRTK